MSVEENKALVRRFIEEVQSKHNLDLADELIDPNQVDHSGMAPEGLDAVEGFKKMYSGFLSAFPDLKAVIHFQVAEGDKVVTFKTFHGTHGGPFRGIPATGEKVTLDVIDIFRLSGGKMVEHWAAIDWTKLMQQIGAARPPG